MKGKKIIISIVTGIFVTIVGGLCLEWCKDENIIIVFIGKIGNLLKDMFLFQVPIWAVILSLITLVLIIRITYYIMKPPFYDYKEDQIYNLYWEWEWTHENTGWIVTNLRACCPKDKTMMAHDGRCPLCGFIHPIPNALYLEKVEFIILHRVKLRYLKKK